MNSYVEALKLLFRNIYSFDLIMQQSKAYT
jgi:hypothetical protein